MLREEKLLESLLTEKVTHDLMRGGWKSKTKGASVLLYSNLVMVNGLIVDRRFLPPEIQELYVKKKERK